MVIHKLTPKKVSFEITSKTLILNVSCKLCQNSRIRMLLRELLHFLEFIIQLLLSRMLWWKTSLWTLSKLLLVYSKQNLLVSQWLWMLWSKKWSTSFFVSIRVLSCCWDCSAISWLVFSSSRSLEKQTLIEFVNYSNSFFLLDLFFAAFSKL